MRSNQVPAHVEVLSDLAPQPFAKAWGDLADGQHFWFQWRLAVLQHLLDELEVPLQTPLSVLDLGSGPGVLRTQLESITEWRIDAADVDAVALSRNQSSRGRTLLYQVSDRAPSLEAAYDLVILFDVLEHIEESRPFVASVLHHLRRGGLLLIDVPALPACYGRYDRAVGHHRRYLKRTLIDDLGTADIDIVDLRFWGLSLVPVLIARNLAALTGRSESAVIQKGFALPGRLLHRLLGSWARREAAWIRRPPIGASLLATVRKL